MNPIADLVLNLADGTALPIRPPTLGDQRRVMNALGAAGIKVNDPDPNATGNSEFVYRLLYECARFDGRPRPATVDEFLDLIPLVAITEAGEAFADFFGRRTPSRNTSTPSPASASDTETPS